MTAIDSGIDTLAPVSGLSVTLADGVLSVTIDRPKSLNSLNLAILAGIADAMEQAATDPLALLEDRHGLRLALPEQAPPGINAGYPGTTTE